MTPNEASWAAPFARACWQPVRPRWTVFESVSLRASQALAAIRSDNHGITQPPPNWVACEGRSGFFGRREILCPPIERHGNKDRFGSRWKESGSVRWTEREEESSRWMLLSTDDQPSGLVHFPLRCTDGSVAPKTPLQPGPEHGHPGGAGPAVVLDRSALARSGRPPTSTSGTPVFRITHERWET